MKRARPHFDLDEERSVYTLGLIAATIVEGATPLRLGTSAYVRSAIVRALPGTKTEALSGALFQPGSVELGKKFFELMGSRSPGEFKWPELSTQAEAWFARGLLDANGSVRKPDSGKHLLMRFRGPSKGLVDGLQRRFGGNLCNLELTLSGVDALDTLGTLYAGARCFRKKNRRRYLGWISSPQIEKDSFLDFHLLRSEAVAPFKERVSDSGYDLTLISREKTLGNVVLYGSGISIRPPPGHYFDVVPRSSIIKHGYLLANNVGVIDRAYRGEILVPLLKVDADAPDLQLPARVVQLIPRAIRHFETRRVDRLDATSRGAGGFGSSG